MGPHHGSDARPHPCAGSVRLNRAPDPCQNGCAVLADQTIVHSHRSRHTCGHFLLPIPAIVACAHLRLQPIRCILPHNIQEKRKDASDSSISALRKLISVLNKACSQSRAGSRGGQSSPSVKLYCTSNTAKCLCLSFECQGMNEFKIFKPGIGSRAVTYL